MEKCATWEGLLRDYHVGEVLPGGLLAVVTQSPARWHYQSGLIDPRKGTISRVPVDFDGGTEVPVWTRDGKLVASGVVKSSTLWRFDPVR
jgi:hypothetical protein